MFKSFSFKSVFTGLEGVSKSLSEFGEQLDKSMEEIEKGITNFESTITQVGDQKLDITSNNGHVIVEGPVKSLKVNGTDVVLPNFKK